MFSHVFLGTNQFERALSFYRPLMELLGLKAQGGRPLFVLGHPDNGEPATPGNGQMVALLAPCRAIVDELHARALQLGGRDEGPPGLRPHYHAHYHGAYFRDLDGHKLCVVCHLPPSDGSA